MIIKRINYVYQEDECVPKYMTILETVPKERHWYIKKVFIYNGEKWLNSSKYTHNIGMGPVNGIVKYCVPEVEEYFRMLVKYEGYGVE